MLISSFHLKNGTIIIPLLLFYLNLGLECTKIHRFVQYTPKKFFSSFVQSAVNARRQGDENPNSSVVAETMKFLPNNSYGYQIMERSRHTVTKCLNDEKTHSAINNKLFKRLNFVTDQLYEVELVKSEIEHREPIIVGFFILQYAKLRMLGFIIISLKSFAIPKSMKSLKWIPTLYTYLCRKRTWKILFSQRKETNGKQYVRVIVQIASLLMQQATSSQEHVVVLARSMIRESRDCLKKNSGVPKCCACVAKPTVVQDRKSNKYKFSRKGLSKRTLEDCGDGPM